MVVLTEDGRECYAVVCRSYQLHGAEGQLKDFPASVSHGRVTVSAKTEPKNLRRLLRTSVPLSNP